MDKSSEEALKQATAKGLTIIDGIKKSLTEIQSWKPPQPQDPKLILPDNETFERFYQGINVYQIHPIASVHKNIIQLKALDSIQVSTEALVELLAEKLKQPILVHPTLKIKSPPPFVADIDTVLNEKLFWLNAEFNKILALQDPRIAKLCQDTHEARAYLLLTRIKYGEWKESLIEYIVKKAEDRLEQNKNAEIRTIRDDYDKKYKAEQGRLNTEIERYKKEHLRYKNIATDQSQIIENIKNDAENAKGQVEDLHRKMRDAEDKATDMESKWVQAQKKLEDAQKKLEKHEKNQWTQSPTMSKQPSYKNDFTKEVFNFPCTMEEFKNSYQLMKSEEGFDVYEAKGKEPLKIPEGLITVINQSATLPLEINGKGKKGGKKLSDTTLRVLKAIQDSDEPLNVQEIEAVSGVKTTNLSGRHIPLLLEAGDIIMEVGEDGTKRYSGA